MLGIYVYMLLIFLYGIVCKSYLFTTFINMILRREWSAHYDHRVLKLIGVSVIGQIDNGDRVYMGSGCYTILHIGA